MNSHTLSTVTAAPPAVPDAALSVQALVAQVALIQQVMSAAMKSGEHYGPIPGCGDKPTLLKPGAEKLCLLFRLAPSYAIEERNLDGDHREYRIVASLASIPSGAFVGQGVGTCSTMEGKYRYRRGGDAASVEITDRPVPRAYWDLKKDNPAKAQELLGGKGHRPAKDPDGNWMIARVKGGGGSAEKVENDNPADVFNTVLKMAKKRALVDAVLTATAASDIFAQDLEDLKANMDAHADATAPAPALTPAPQATPAPQQKPQPKPAPQQQAQAVTVEVEHPFDTLRDLMARDGITESELRADLCARMRPDGVTALHPDEDLPEIEAKRLRGIVTAWPRIAAAIIAARQQAAA